MKKYDICIIGGGASGMAAAAEAVETAENIDIIIIEKKEALGKKVAATGNGRCNITNTEAYRNDVVKAFLEHNGIVLRTEEAGRMYPYSGRASHVVMAFERKLRDAGVDIVTGKSVIAVKKDGDIFKIATDDGKIIEASKLIIACGGKSSPQLGTTGDGYAWAKSFGHTVTRLAPVLTNIELFESDFGGKEVKGVRAKGAVSLVKNGEDEVLATENGEIQFNETGISGICVFNISRFVKVEEGETIKDLSGKYEVVIDFMPEYEFTEALEIIKSQASCCNEIKDALVTVIDEKLIPVIIKKARKIYGQIDDAEKVAMVLKEFKCSVKGAGGWKNAQVTSGGVKLSEICKDTMESKLVQGLYFAGEILDYDGPCGGYNLNFAWYTGIKAGKAASR
ncbi:MAG: aminoacetone oxidase family FAD-binding enzyme [Clostridiales bacterium]|nr:aminoacetone oxidase family FAD-binding enzyme [Clostridiales bacterium]